MTHFLYKRNPSSIDSGRIEGKTRGDKSRGAKSTEEKRRDPSLEFVSKSATLHESHLTVATNPALNIVFIFLAVTGLRMCILYIRGSLHSFKIC